MAEADRVIGVGVEVGERLGHAEEAHGVELIEGGMVQHDVRFLQW